LREQIFPRLTAVIINPPKESARGKEEYGTEEAWDWFGTLNQPCRNIQRKGMEALGKLKNLRSLGGPPLFERNPKEPC